MSGKSLMAAARRDEQPGSRRCPRWACPRTPRYGSKAFDDFLTGLEDHNDPEIRRRAGYFPDDDAFARERVSGGPQNIDDVHVTGSVAASLILRRVGHMRLRFGYEKAEHHRVDESSVHPSGLSQHALGTKPDPHSDSAHCHVVSECVELEPMQSTGCEPYRTDAYYFGAESSTAERGPQ